MREKLKKNYFLAQAPTPPGRGLDCHVASIDVRMSEEAEVVVEGRILRETLTRETNGYITRPATTSKQTRTEEHLQHHHHLNLYYFIFVYL